MPIRHYDIDLAVFPREGKIRAGVEFVLEAREECHKMEFLLHCNLDIAGLSGPEVDSYTVERTCSYPFTPEASTVEVTFVRPLEKGERTKVKLTYSGVMHKVPEAWGVNCVGEKWVELGLYGPWFPWCPSTKPEFTFSVDLQIPEGYGTAGSGEIHSAGGKWRLESQVPAFDIVVVAAPGLETLESSKGLWSTSVSFSQADKSLLAQKVLDTVSRLLDDYTRLFGLPPGLPRVSVVLSPRKKGGGYARGGLVVLANLDLPAVGSPGVVRWIAHEVSHLWWSGADVDSWEDWLNEGFAEYWALQAVRAEFGDGAFLELVESKRLEIVGLPPIRGLSREADKAYTVLYSKTPLLLLDLSREIGEGPFLELSRRFVRAKVKNTPTFLDLLARIAGENTAARFDQRLGE